MIDRAALLADLKPAVTALEGDFAARVRDSSELADTLARRHAQATEAKRTAASLEDWRADEITQAAVAWVLAGVFVRFLEDNELIDRPLIAGPGQRRDAAAGARDEYFAAHPSHSDREYLEHAFRTVAQHPAVAGLFDDRHNPLWALGPTADGASELLQLWRAIDPDTGELEHDYSDAELDTRFLGDLYQDLSEAARKRYALLQTPIFVEEFILDHTLAPAIAEFGLNTVRMIDPTCGSGHFLIGAFERLFARWREDEPGSSAGELAYRALDAIYGVDLNPYATAIARFRLTIAALRALGITRLADAPALPLNIATGDSLLHGPERGQFPGFERRVGIEHVYETEDAAELHRILGQGYHAVVGNPPYINVSDAALRDAYRARYESCHGKYALSVPFMERFFELATPELPGERGVGAGFVGKITANSFMKREFGTPLVEKFLPSVDVSTLIDTSGAYIPGHGTPTLILFGRQRQPQATTIRVLDGVRGEPARPDDPARGLVWSAILDRLDAPGTQDRFIRSADVPRSEFAKHPMTLGIGRDLRKLLERRATTTVLERMESAGFASFTGMDDGFIIDRPTASRNGLGSQVARDFVVGDSVRDWSVRAQAVAITPYDAAREPLDLEELEPGAMRLLWPNRSVSLAIVSFGGKTRRALGDKWWTWYRWVPEKYRTPLTITWGEVATHNHFVLDRGGKVFKQTAPVIKLPAGASEDDHFRLLGALNSATACFWLQQVCHNKGGPGGAHSKDEKWHDFYQHNATKVGDAPLPSRRPTELARALDAAATQRASLPDLLAASSDGGSVVRDLLAGQAARDSDLLGQQISLQEELDWQVMASFGLVPDDLAPADGNPPTLRLGQRAFEIVLARQVERGETKTVWFERHKSKPIVAPPTDWPADYRDLVERRIELIESDADVGLIERPEHKRRWAGRAWADREREALEAFVLDALEELAIWKEPRLRSTAELADVLRPNARAVEACTLLAGSADAELSRTVADLVASASVPFLAAYRYKPKGLEKRARWERAWEQQREEDRTGTHQDIVVPPRYTSADFRSQTVWKLRGKLDVPKERFISYSGAERGADTSLVVGWAGWDDLTRARALASRVLELRQAEAADAELLTPLLAGVQELLPWIQQWHNESDPDYGGPPGAFYNTWLDQQVSELALTRGSLRDWKPS